MGCRRWIILLIMCLVSISGYGQVPESEQLEDLMMNEEEEKDMTPWLEQMNEYLEQPLNLNKAGANELQALGLLNHLQIEAILRHRRETGPFLEIEELQSIDELDMETILRMAPYVSVAPVTLFRRKPMRQEISHTLTLRSAVSNQRKAKGYENNTYQGSYTPFYMKYQAAISPALKAGLILEKDPGERNIDFMGFFMQLQNIGRIEQLVIGDYQLQYGQGLEIWSGFGGGKNADPFFAKRNAGGIRANASAAESQHLRGLATSLRINNRVRAAFFYSRRRRDAYINENGNLSLPQNGLHRTEKEIGYKGQAQNTLAGTHLSFRFRNLSAGLSLHRELIRYRTHIIEDRNISIDHQYLFRNLVVFGEMALDKNRQIAILQGFTIIPEQRISISVIYRNYARQYASMRSAAFAESSGTANENGIFLAVQYQPRSKTIFQSYIDLFRFPYLRYRTEAPAQGHEWLLQWQQTIKKQKVSLRVKHKERPYTLAGPEYIIPPLSNTLHTQYRLQLEYKVTEGWTLRSRIDLNDHHVEGKARQYGTMISQDLLFHPMNARYSADVRYALFDTGYETRVYALEQDLLYTYSAPALQNEGFRFYINIRYRLHKQCNLYLKYARTGYFDQQIIGSGNEELTSDHRDELRAQVIIKW